MVLCIALMMTQYLQIILNSYAHALMSMMVYVSTMRIARSVRLKF